MAFDPSDFYRPLKPNGRRRAPWHDYRSKCIYMITINKNRGIGNWSRLEGIVGNHDWPPHTKLTPIGEIIGREISAIKKSFPDTMILRRVIMPDHLHFVIYQTKPAVYHLGEVIELFKKNCLRAYRAELCENFDSSLFEENYHDRILFRSGQLKRMLDYVSSNPRRCLERRNARGFHRRCLLRHVDGRPFEAYGNIHLLEDFDISAVKISRKYSPEELLRKKLNWKRAVENCGVLASPFISAAEKRVRDWAVDNGGRLIIIDRNGFGSRFHPKGEKLHQLCSEGRLLIIAPVEHKTSLASISRADCEYMNNLALDIEAYKLQKA